MIDVGHVVEWWGTRFLGGDLAVLERAAPIYRHDMCGVIGQGCDR